MANSIPEVLVAVRVGLAKGKAQLSEFTELVTPALKLQRISSIYQIQFVGSDWRGAGDEQQGLTVCFAGESEFTAHELLAFLKEIEEQLAKDAAHKKVSVYLLAYGPKVAMSKSLNLPYSEWHTDPTLLLPAKEVCPEFTHPVLHKTLSELAAVYVEDQWGKFYAQGKSLMKDFPG